MEIKKSNKASLENKKVLFREIGMIAALAIVLGAFEWSSTDKTVDTLTSGPAVITEEEQVPITQDTPPPPPEQIKEPVMTEELQIVENDVKVETEFISSDDSNQKIEIKSYIEAKPVEEAEEVEEEIPYAVVEEKPKFQDKDANEFTKWVYANLEYPEIAKENGIQGRVTVQFTIDKDGSVKNVKVLRGVDSSLDKAAVNVINKSPKWSPGKMRGRPTKVSYTFPIIFQLR
ncbi:MAG: energy transducer TonB [Bacteroidales bacterium]|nr:energy transducer TonB [Bacteroidales bacterium]